MFTNRILKSNKFTRQLCALGVMCVQVTAVACSSGSELTPVRTVRAAAKPTPDTNAITIAAVGDIMLGSPFPNDTRMPPNDGANLLKVVAPLLTAADLAFGNLEGPLIDGGISEKCKPPATPSPTPIPLPSATPKKPDPIRCYAFRMPTYYAKHLRAAGFDILSVANNHASDFGEAGRAATRRTLDALGIKHAGSNRAEFSTA